MDIEQRAREIAAEAHDKVLGKQWQRIVEEAARLALQEGIRIGLKQAAVIAETHPFGDGTLSSWINTNESPMNATRRHIAAAIRSAKP